MKKFNKILNSGFGQTKISYEKKGNEYILYNHTKFFWITSKNKMVTCENIETLREIDKRCNLGLFKK